MSYQSDSRYNIFEALIIPITGTFGVYLTFEATENIAVQFSIIIIAVLLTIWVIIRTKNKTVEITFMEDHFKIKYFFKKEEHKIPYKNLLRIKYFDYQYRTTAKNKIWFLDKLGIESVVVRPVAKGEDFVTFVKWLKTKNNKIQIEATDAMDYKLQEAFGFRYRKVPKIDT
ncbi:hypothetical protein ACT6NV_02835 [Robiginitalea sp. IMCC44478]|uniref:hypothetical protein n=1 Tax=Robiginitalea sp. IMCC44478 TaxID=3459122 RepID=UPI004042E72F